MKIRKIIRLHLSQTLLYDIFLNKFCGQRKGEVFNYVQHEHCS